MVAALLFWQFMVIDPSPELLSTWPCSQSTPLRPLCRALGRLLPQYCCHGPRTSDHPTLFTSSRDIDLNMGSLRELLFLYLILLYIVTLTVSQPNFLSYYNISESGNYSTNSTYQKNLVALLSSLSNSTDRYGFYSSSVGENPDRVYAIVLCRGDIDLDTCRRCIMGATIKLPQLLPNYKGAIGWYDYCMLRYSDKSINGIEATQPNSATLLSGNALDVNVFNRALGSFLGGLRSQAASGGARRKFATGNTSGPDFGTIYGLMQCTPDLSEMDCNNCLRFAELITQHVYIRGRTGGIILTPSCTLQYETYHFFTKNPADAQPATSDNKSIMLQPTTALVVVLVSISLALTALTLLRLRKRKDVRRKGRTTLQLFDERGADADLPLFDLITIVTATDNFSLANKLGQGGFGPVYKVGGYMSPEYAMQGLFSIKSDVFSFGVLLLEIVSGTKNNSYYQDHSMTLIGHAWDLWREGKALDIVHPFLRDQDSFPAPQVLRCIQIGLLCVQEFATDRPAMSKVAFMLCNETALLSPKQPAFIMNGVRKGPDSSSTSGGAASSVNDVTLSAIDGR
ncbi:hypothetical protein RHSIM_Rhsim07G0195700 [Rhododendron simsii]|uniref:Gnk2-homologous domain-containing protein n=1 Tax=Rhododendron simsii TaxID=118357 RepID=A0A834GL28_RHOSS|nr:hypothetical protein RHSIM_Rhsim07G0195700 [Rhododendron simsii]